MQADRFIEMCARRFGKSGQRAPVVAFDPQMHRLGRGGATRLAENFDLDTGDFLSFLGQLGDDRVAVIGVYLDRAADLVIQERNGEPGFAHHRALIPGGGFKLNLTDGVAGRLCAAGVVVQPAIPGKGKGGLHTGMSQNDLFDLFDQIILLINRQVAAPAHVNDGLFRLGFHEEFGAVIVVDVIDQNRADEYEDRAEGQQRRDRIAGDQMDHPAKGRAAITRFDARAAVGHDTAHCRAAQIAKATPDSHQRHEKRHNAADADGAQNDHPKQKREDLGQARHHRSQDLGAVHSGEGGGHLLQQNRREVASKCRCAPRNWKYQQVPEPEKPCDLRDPLLEPPLGPPGHPAEHRQIDQRHQERRTENKDQGDRQHAHELSRHAGPEQHRQKGAKRGRGRADHRPEHPLGGADIGMHRADALINALVGIFDHHDRTIHQHAHGKDQAEHHDIGNRHAHDRQQGKAQQKRGRDRKAHQKGGADAKRRQDHDHHKGNRRQDRAFKLAYHRGDGARLIVRGAHGHRCAHLVGPAGGGAGDLLAHKVGGVDDVEAFALDHLQGHRGVAVEARGADAILEGQVDRRQIAKPHHPVAIGLDRKAIDIAGFLEGRRDLDRKRALRIVDFACGNKLIVVAHHIDQLKRGDVIGLKAQRVDHHLDHLVAIARDTGLKHRFHALKRVLKILGKPRHRAFGHRAAEVDDDDREFAEVHLAQGVFLGAIGKFGLGGVHRVAHIGKDLGLVPAKLELKRHAAIVFRRRAGHFLEPVQIAQLGFHHLDQQFLAVFGGNAGEGDRNEQGRYLDVGLALFGQADIGQRARQHRKHHEGQHHTRARGGPIDDAGHWPSS